MLKGTDPKLISGGAPTRGKISTAMGNQKMNAVSKSPFSAPPLPKVGAMRGK